MKASKNIKSTTHNTMALVQYSDSIIYACQLAEISATKKYCAARYKDRKKYAARVSIFTADSALLKRIEHHFNGDSPHVCLNNLKYTGKQLSCAKILEADKITQGKSRLYISDGILPKCDDKDPQCYVFDLGETSTKMDNDSCFHEAILTENEGETDNLESSANDADKIAAQVPTLPPVCSLTITDKIYDCHTDNEGIPQVENLSIPPATQKCSDGCADVLTQVQTLPTVCVLTITENIDHFHSHHECISQVENLPISLATQESSANDADNIAAQVPTLPIVCSLTITDKIYDCHTDNEGIPQVENLSIPPATQKCSDVGADVLTQVQTLPTVCLLTITENIDDFHTNYDCISQVENLTISLVTQESSADDADIAAQVPTLPIVCSLTITDKIYDCHTDNEGIPQVENVSISPATQKCSDGGADVLTQVQTLPIVCSLTITDKIYDCHTDNEGIPQVENVSISPATQKCSDGGADVLTQVQTLPTVCVLTITENIDDFHTNHDCISQVENLTISLVTQESSADDADIAAQVPTLPIVCSLTITDKIYDCHTDNEGIPQVENVSISPATQKCSDGGADVLTQVQTLPIVCSLTITDKIYDCHTDNEGIPQVENVSISPATQKCSDGGADVLTQVQTLPTVCLLTITENIDDFHTNHDCIFQVENLTIPLVTQESSADNADIAAQVPTLPIVCSLTITDNVYDCHTDNEGIPQVENVSISSATQKDSDGGTDSLSAHNSNDDPHGIPAQVHGLTGACSSHKPRIRNIGKVEYELVRTRHSMNSTDEGGLSFIGNLLDNDPAILNTVGDDAAAGFFKDIVYHEVIYDNSYEKDSKSLESFDELANPVLSSTVINSTSTQSTSTNTVEDSRENNDNDGDYEPSNSYTGNKDASSDSSCDESKNETTLTFHVPGKPFSAPDDLKMQVQNSSTPSYTKRYFCLYCQKLQTKLARHLELMHNNEEDVKKFINLPKKNLERQKIIATLRKNGNHLFNSDQRFNDGTLLVCRRPNQRMQKSAIDFIVCAKCKGQYAKSVIRHHWRKCTKRVKSDERIIMVKGRAIMARINAIADEPVRNHIFSYLREDNVVRSIRYDEAVILYANKQCNRLGMHQHQYQGIRAQIRLLGRFLLAVKDNNNTVTDFSSIYTPRCYDSCIVAAKQVAGFKKNDGTYQHPTVALNIGTLLKQVGELIRSKYIKTEEPKKQKKVENFLKLLNEDYGAAINRAVAETHSQNNRRKKVELPSASDIKKLQKYLKAEREKYQKNLMQKFCDEAWHKLAGNILISLQLFNRRRAGEIERIYIEDFESHQSIDAIGNKELFESLSKEAQEVAKKYVRFMIRGKRGRGVPVLVPCHLLECMKLIRKFRREARVPDQNPYFFGLRCGDPARHKYLRACNLLREFASLCGAAVPSSLRGTKLRKHIATQCINLNLSETQVSDLANFMGHHEKIHKEIYRQPIVERDIIKISKLLELAQGTGNDGEPEIASESDSEEEAAIENQLSNKNVKPQPSKQDINKKGPRTSSTNRTTPRTMSPNMTVLSTRSSNIATPSTSSTNRTTPCSMPSNRNTPGTRSPNMTVLSTRSSNITPSTGSRKMRAPISSSKSCKRKRPSTDTGAENKRHHVSDMRRAWSDAEKCAVLKAFEKYLESTKLPSLPIIQDVIAKQKYLQRRTAAQVKSWIYNERKKRCV